MKKALTLSAAVLALAACSNEEFIGESTTKEVVEKEIPILFSTTSNAVSRADHYGADAAELLGKGFVVEGAKGDSSFAKTIVFDNYNVKWTENTAETTESNTADWEYVGLAKNTNSKITTANQSIKYWDYAEKQYDFIAYSTGTNGVVYGTTAPATGQVNVSPIDTAHITTSAYTIQGGMKELAKCYIADLVTIKNTGDASSKFGKEVKIDFRSLSAKVRIAFYETVPGYSVRDIEFYASADATTKVADNIPTLYSSTSNIYNNGTYTVYYPTLNSDSTDNNKAHVKFAAATDGTSTTVALDTLNYLRAQASTNEAASVKYIGDASNTATYALNKVYTTVLPNESATSLTLRCNYTLVSNDGSKETIKVWGATAVVPAQYCQWKSNYAYTYIFKISDATNGATQKLGGAVEGLRPITFDAVVLETEDYVHESITTVATPSITTYGYKDGVVKSSANNEYPKGSDVYVMVQNGATQKGDLNTYGKLYKAATTNTIEPVITEAEVMDALNMGTEDASTKVVTGRNKITLTPAATGTVTFPEEVPGADGNNFEVTKNTTAKLAALAAGTYAYVYQVSTGTASTYNTAVVLNTEPADWDTTYETYYTDFDCTTKATETFTAGTYYQLLTNKNNTYAVKVIKVND